LAIVGDRVIFAANHDDNDDCYDYDYDYDYDSDHCYDDDDDDDDDYYCHEGGYEWSLVFKKTFASL
ncbi:hypothetical protein A2U01_0053254, partial [Trifolium medium]|nr:hypothetical protein [Trifolium medium]